MTFTGLSSTWILAVFAGGAAALVALHLLRPQPPRQPVMTLMFWRQLKAPSPANRLWGRILRWGTLLFLLLVPALLAAALARPRLGGDAESGPLVVVLDAGMSMASSSGQGTRLQEALRRATATAEDSAHRPVAVIVADPLPRVVLHFGQPAGVAGHILEGLEPAQAPAASEAALQMALALLEGRPGGQVAWFTDRPEIPSAVASQARSICRIPVGTAGENAAILHAAFEPSEPDPSVGALRVRVGYWGAAAREITVLAASESGISQIRQFIGPGSTADFVLQGQAADGRAVRLDLPGAPGIAADDVLSIVPARNPANTFLAEAGVPAELRMALEASGARAAGGNEPALRVRSIEAKAAGPDVPEIVIVPGTGIAAGRTIAGVAGSALSDGLDFEEAVTGVGGGLKEIAEKVAPVLLAGDEPVAAISKERPRRLYVSSALLCGGATVTRRPAYLAWIARASLWLQDQADPPPVVSLERLQADPLWLPADAPRVGVAGSRQASNLTLTRAAAVPADLAGSGRHIEPFIILLLAALAVIWIDALLHARGRIA